jgi:glycosyltransferase involved in cell wall biosynthesis
LLEAVQTMPEEVHLVLAGQGEEEQALKQIVETSMDGMRVPFLGNTDDMPSFYQAIDIFSLPSFKEGYPLTPLEAQSCGVPVVASDTGRGKRNAVPIDWATGTCG